MLLEDANEDTLWLQVMMTHKVSDSDSEYDVHIAASLIASS